MPSKTVLCSKIGRWFSFARKSRLRGGKLHLTGLCSEGGVHSHLSHILGLLELAKAQGISEVCIHAITDGRDTTPKEGVEALAKIESYIER
jgi:2,3-bisphosphoglycerate-independent phosphoglycerate mutase